jgi:hypothetical protein
VQAPPPILPAVYAHTPEVQTKMPQAAIIIFLLFFAVLAFAWFYLQRAKARDAAKPADTASAKQTDSAS